MRLGLIFRGQSLLPSRLGLELSMRALVVDFRSGSQGLKRGFLLWDNSYGTKNQGDFYCGTILMGLRTGGIRLEPWQMIKCEPCTKICV